MRYVVTAAEMKRADRETSRYFGIPELVLMENAARETVRYIRKHHQKKRRILVLAGGGNNGGDGMAVGRILFQQGYSVTVFFCAKRDKATKSTLHQLQVLEKYGVPVTDHFPDAEYDIIIDAVLGTGLTRKVDGAYAQIIKYANTLNAYKIACDIPSGIESDKGGRLGEAFRADVTLCYGFLKRGLVLYPGAEYAGNVVCLNIGISEHSFLGEMPALFTYEAGTEKAIKKQIHTLLPKRSKHSHKGSFGRVLLLAGSKNMNGACELAAKAIYRSGAGLVRVLTAEENRMIIQKKVPEAVLHTYETGKTGLKKEDNIRQVLAEDVAWADCIVSGCGLSVNPPAVRLMDLLFEELEAGNSGKEHSEKRKKKLLFDADALNIIAQNKQLKERLIALNKPESVYETALTPHLKELERLSGWPAGQITEDIAGCCLSFTKEWNVITVCKDARTVVGLTDETAYVNRTGNSGMATAGSGDVLSGMIGGLAAQGMELSQACVLGVYVHGAAGDLAAEKHGEYAMMAHDMIKQLKKLLR